MAVLYLRLEVSAVRLHTPVEFDTKHLFNYSEMVRNGIGIGANN